MLSIRWRQSKWSFDKFQAHRQLSNDLLKALALRKNVKTGSGQNSRTREDIDVCVCVGGGSFSLCLVALPRIAGKLIRWDYLQIFPLCFFQLASTSLAFSNQRSLQLPVWEGSMGSLPMCNCRALGQQPDVQTEVRVDNLETKRLETARKLFELADLNGDGLLSVDEFSEMGLNQTKVHSEKQLTSRDEQLIKDEFVQKYQHELDSSLRPVTCDKYQEYILRFANNIDPGDLKAGSCQSFPHLSPA